MKHILIVVLSIVLAGCGGGSSSNPTPGTPGTPNLLRISTTPTDMTTIVLGGTTTFHATAFYSDGSSSDITQKATWTSSVPAVASVVLNSTGAVVTGSTLGQSVLDAAFNGMTYDVGLTVAVTAPGPGPTPPPPVKTKLELTSSSAAFPTIVANFSEQITSPPMTLAVGDEITLTAAWQDQNGQPMLYTEEALWEFAGTLPVANFINCPAIISPAPFSMSCTIQASLVGSSTITFVVRNALDVPDAVIYIPINVTP